MLFPYGIGCLETAMLVAVVRALLEDARKIPPGTDVVVDATWELVPSAETIGAEVVVAMPENSVGDAMADVVSIGVNSAGAEVTGRLRAVVGRASTDVACG